MITYQPLSADSLAIIFNQQIAALEKHIRARLAERAFTIELSEPARALLLKLGTSAEFGARELKRTILRKLTQPLAALLESGRIPPESRVRAELARGRRESRIDRAGRSNVNSEVAASGLFGLNVLAAAIAPSAFP